MVLWQSSEESDELSLIRIDLEAFVKQMEARLIIGEIDIESGFDALSKGCEARNLKRYVEILQKAYNRYAAAKLSTHQRLDSKIASSLFLHHQFFI